MQLFYRPITPWFVGQKFGDNRVCVDNATNSKFIPCDGLNPPPGYRSIYSMMKGHNGLDIPCNAWAPVYAAREGKVIEKETEVSRGLGVGILHGPYEGKYYKTRYWHFISLDVDLGDYVSTGELIGYADSTGYSTNNHLHFEIKETDSFGNTLNGDNGYFGAIDPELLLFPTAAVQVNLLRLSIEKLRVVLQTFIDGMGKIKT